ncbi:MAG: type II toxin-antitoxin system VapC family toxin [Solirubrobacterales bacterium]|nr:type II toxin-antitoxin system VapC family toxin [Solirubrobacterales bacterium]
MTRIVLDASVITALYIEEELSLPARDEIVRHREAGDEFHAPDLLLIECANALWKRVGRGELERASAMTAIEALAEVDDFAFHPMDAQLVPAALSLAVTHSMTAYDAAYGALALRLGGTLVTGDRRLAGSAGMAGIPVTVLSADPA